MSLFRSMDASSSGLTAQRLRMDSISNNIANVNTTETEDGGPYRRQEPVFKTRFQEELRRSGVSDSEEKINGVKVKEIVESNKPPRLEYNPDHPQANEEGYVEKPNVNIVEEMTNMISATRAYEANVSALDSSKDMYNSAIRIST